jgi:cytochrome b561
VGTPLAVRETVMTARKSYGTVARWLHWTIAAMILCNIMLGLFHDGLGHVIPAMPLHKAIGITVLALTLVRIVWRITHALRPCPGPCRGGRKPPRMGCICCSMG